MSGRTTFPKGHVIRMSLECTTGGMISVAKCECGWECRVPWSGKHYAAQDDAIDRHWSHIEKGLTA